MIVSYYIDQLDKYMTFEIECTMQDGTLSGKDSRGHNVFIYRDGVIEISEPVSNAHHRCRRKHEIYTGHRVTNESLSPYQYIHAGKIRDKRSNSMSARPFYPYGRY